MSKRYEAFLADPDCVPREVEICLFIKEMMPGPRKYSARFVKALLADVPDALPGSDTLQLRTFDGKLHSKTIAMRIVEELGVSVHGRPYTLHTGLFPENEKV